MKKNVLTNADTAEFRLHRADRTSDTTFGHLTMDHSAFCCHVLEDVERKVKIPGKTAIKCGRYRIRVSMSKRFKRLMVEVLEVPEFTGIRWHRGATANDTEGCLIVGWRRNGNMLTLSRSCEEAVTALVQQLENNGVECYITITSDFEPI